MIVIIVSLGSIYSIVKLFQRGVFTKQKKKKVGRRRPQYSDIEDDLYLEKKKKSKTRRVYSDIESDLNLENNSSSDSSSSNGDDDTRIQKKKKPLKRNPVYSDVDDDKLRLGWRQLSRKQRIKKNPILSEMSYQSIDTLLKDDPMNNYSGIGTYGQGTVKLTKKNTVCLYLSKEDSETIKVSGSLNAANYALIFKTSTSWFSKKSVAFGVTVSHTYKIAKRTGRNMYISSDEMNGIAYKCKNIVVASGKRDHVYFSIDFAPPGMKDLTDKFLTRKIFDQIQSCCTVFGRYGERNEYEVIVGDTDVFHEPVTYCVDGTNTTFTDMATSYFAFFKGCLSTYGDCGLPYVTLDSIPFLAGKILGIHCMGNGADGIAMGIMSCVTKEDLSDYMNNLKPQNKPNGWLDSECFGCNNKGTWKPNDFQEGLVYWNQEHDVIPGEFANELRIGVDYIKSHHPFNRKICGVEKNFGKSSGGTQPHSHFKITRQYEWPYYTKEDQFTFLHLHGSDYYKVTGRKVPSDVVVRRIKWKSNSKIVNFFIQHPWIEEFVFYGTIEGEIITGEIVVTKYDMTQSQTLNIRFENKEDTEAEVTYPSKYGNRVVYVNHELIKPIRNSVFSKIVGHLHDVPFSDQNDKVTVVGSFKSNQSPIPTNNYFRIRGSEALEQTFPIQKLPFNPDTDQAPPEQKEKLIKNNFGELCPRSTQCVQWQNPQETPDPKILKHALDQYKMHFLEQYSNLKPLTDYEVLHGYAQGHPLYRYLNKLELNKSSGWTLKKIFGITTKRECFNVTDKGEITFSENEAGQYLQQIYQETVSKVQKGEHYLVVYNDLCKMEKLKKEKNFIGRIFCAQDTLGVLLERKFLGEFCARAMKKDMTVGIGSNPYSCFDSIYRELTSKGFYFTGDYSRFDKTVPKVLFESICKCLEFANPSISKVFNPIFKNIYSGIHVSGKTMYIKDKGMPSGCFCTAPLNCKLNDFAIFNCWLSLGYKFDGVLRTFPEYQKNVFRKYYGDDVVLGVSPSDVDWFNMEALSKEMRTLFQMELGTSSKDGSEVKKFEELEEMSWISRFFRKLDNYDFVVGALKKSTIEAYLYWTTSLEPQHIGKNLTICLEEAALWDNDYYLKIYHAIQTILSKNPNIRPFFQNKSRLSIQEDIYLQGAFANSFNYFSKGSILTEGFNNLYYNNAMDYVSKLNLSFQKSEIPKPIYETSQIAEQVFRTTCKVESSTTVGEASSKKASKEKSAEAMWKHLHPDGIKEELAKQSLLASIRLARSTDFCAPNFELREIKPYVLKRPVCPVDISEEYKRQEKEHKKRNPHHPDALTRKQTMEESIETICDLTASALRFTDNLKDAMEMALSWVKWDKFANMDIDAFYFVADAIEKNGLSEMKFDAIKKQHAERGIQVSNTWVEDMYELDLACVGDEAIQAYIRETTLHCRMVEFLYEQITGMIVIHDADKFNLSSIIPYTWKWVVSQQVAKLTQQGNIDLTHDQVTPSQSDQTAPPIETQTLIGTNKSMMGEDIGCLNPDAVAVTNIANTGNPINFYEYITQNYLLNTTISVKSDTPIDTEILRLGCRPQDLSPDQKLWVQLHDAFVLSVDYRFNMPVAFGAMGNFIVGWVRDIDRKEPYTRAELRKIRSVIHSITNGVVRFTASVCDLITAGAWYREWDDLTRAGPNPGIVIVIDSPFDQVNRDNLTTYTMTVESRLSPNSIYGSPGRKLPGAVSQTLSSISLGAFVKQPVDLVITNNQIGTFRADVTANAITTTNYGTFYGDIDQNYTGLVTNFRNAQIVFASFQCDTDTYNNIGQFNLGWNVKQTHDYGLKRAMHKLPTHIIVPQGKVLSIDFTQMMNYSLTLTGADGESTIDVKPPSLLGTLVTYSAPQLIDIADDNGMSGTYFYTHRIEFAEGCYHFLSLYKQSIDVKYTFTDSGLQVLLTGDGDTMPISQVITNYNNEATEFYTNKNISGLQTPEYRTISTSKLTIPEISFQQTAIVTPTGGISSQTLPAGLMRVQFIEPGTSLSVDSRGAIEMYEPLGMESVYQLCDDYVSTTGSEGFIATVSSSNLSNFGTLVYTNGTFAVSGNDSFSILTNLQQPILLTGLTPIHNQINLAAKVNGAENWISVSKIKNLRQFRKSLLLKSKLTYQGNAIGMAAAGAGQGIGQYFSMMQELQNMKDLSAQEFEQELKKMSAKYGYDSDLMKQQFGLDLDNKTQLAKLQGDIQKSLYDKQAENQKAINQQNYDLDLAYHGATGVGRRVGNVSVTNKNITGLDNNNGGQTMPKTLNDNGQSMEPVNEIDEDAQEVGNILGSGVEPLAGKLATPLKQIGKKTLQSTQLVDDFDNKLSSQSKYQQYEKSDTNKIPRSEFASKLPLSVTSSMGSTTGSLSSQSGSRKSSSGSTVDVSEYFNKPKTVEAGTQTQISSVGNIKNMTGLRGSISMRNPNYY